MSVYTSGSLKIITGSQTVKGNGTNFPIYITAGNYLRVSNDTAWYEVASVVDATELTLTGRYANTSYQTSRTAEQIATANTATKIYSGSLDYTPAIRNSVVINASVERFVDDGGGNLTGDQGGSGTFSYDDCAWSITLGTPLSATANFTASYFSGDMRTGLDYRIITDYTSNYEFPEMSQSDTGFAHIYTKAIRLIDSKMNNASSNSVTIQSYLKMGAHQYLIFGANNTEASIIANATSVDASCKGSLYISKAGTLWIFDSDTTATRFQKY